MYLLEFYCFILINTAQPQASGSFGGDFPMPQPPSHSSFPSEFPMPQPPSHSGFPMPQPPSHSTYGTEFPMPPQPPPRPFTPDFNMPQPKPASSNSGFFSPQNAFYAPPAPQQIYPNQAMPGMEYISNNPFLNVGLNVVEQGMKDFTGKTVNMLPNEVKIIDYILNFLFI